MKAVRVEERLERDRVRAGEAMAERVDKKQRVSEDQKPVADAPPQESGVPDANMGTDPRASASSDVARSSGSPPRKRQPETTIEELDPNTTNTDEPVIVMNPRDQAELDHPRERLIRR